MCKCVVRLVTLVYAVLAANLSYMSLAYCYLGVSIPTRSVGVLDWVGQCLVSVFFNLLLLLRIWCKSCQASEEVGKGLSMRTRLITELALGQAMLSTFCIHRWYTHTLLSI